MLRNVMWSIIIVFSYVLDYYIVANNATK